MNAFTRDQKLAMLVVPVLLFGLLGTSYASAYGRNLTEEEQAAIEEAHSLRESGEYTKAREVLVKAGLSRGMGMGHFGATTYGTREAIRDAVESGDYDAFLNATENTMFAGEVTKEEFDTMTKAHELRESGDFEGARELMDEAGLRPHMGIHRGMGMGMHRGW